jgi:hypothetical protein
MGRTPKNLNEGDRHGKTTLTPGYQLVLPCTVLALIFRMFTVLKMIPPFSGLPGGSAISYLSFLHGAVLFFLPTIASWCRTAKS